MGEKSEAETKLLDVYTKISNRLFYGLSNKIFKAGYGQGLKEDLISASIPVFSISFMSIAFFSAFIMLILGVLYSVFGFLLNQEIVILARNMGISLALGAITFYGIYSYPASEKKGMANRIDEELPFIALQMSSIAGSGISPSKIFEVVIGDKESPNIKKEFKKIINQINLYGYDVITALKNVARDNPSKKLAELLGGMASSISEGGDLSEFLKKRAETLFFDFKLSREKYTKLAETFMNIYISIVIMAPMIFSLLMILIGVSGFGGGMDPGVMTILLILGIALINIVFLVVLHLKQPSL